MSTHTAEIPAAENDSQLAMRRGLYAVGSRATRAALFFARGLVETHGLENVDVSRPTIIAPVHQSGWDIPAVGGEMPMHFLAKRELANNRLLGNLICRLGGIMIERGEELSEDNKKDITRAFDERVPICIFPQGTRNRLKDNKIDPDSLHPGAAFIALQHGANINPVGILGTAKNEGLGPVVVVYGPPIMVEAVGEREAIRSIYRKPLMKELHAGMQAAQDEALWRRNAMLELSGLRD